jgi:hypothetical protein
MKRLMARWRDVWVGWLAPLAGLALGCGSGEGALEQSGLVLASNEPAPLAFGKDLFATLNERFDSSPYFTPLELDESEWTNWAEHLVDACIRENGAQAFAHVSTANVARDMDALRAALGEGELSYLGYS